MSACDTCDPGTSTLAKVLVSYGTPFWSKRSTDKKTAGPCTHQCVLAHFLILFPTLSMFPTSPAGLRSQVKLGILREDRDENG